MLGDDGIRIIGQPSIGTCSSTSADLKVTANTLLKDGDIVLATNCQHATVFQIANFNNLDNVVHNTGNSVSPGNSTKDLGACYNNNGELVRLSTRSYYIRANPASEPALYRRVGADDAEELVEGVENLQITYGVDTSAPADKTVDAYVKADAVTDWSRVLTVRISLLMVSRSDESIATAPQSYTYNGATTTPADRLLRKAFTTTIAVRNRL